MASFLMGLSSLERMAEGNMVRCVYLYAIGNLLAVSHVLSNPRLIQFLINRLQQKLCNYLSALAHLIFSFLYTNTNNTPNN